MSQRKRTDYIVVHCADTPATMDIGAKEIDRWHREQGWLKIGYHLVIRRNGEVEKGRDLDEPGAHVQGYNHLSVGICLVGGMNATKTGGEDNFTEAQWASLKSVLRDLKQKYPQALIVGHHDLNPSKECPCFDVQGWVEQNL